MAGRATGVAQRDRVLRPVVPHDDDLLARPGRAAARVESGRQQLRDVRRRSLPTPRRVQPRRLRHRRRDPLQRRPRGDGAGGSRGRPQLGAVHRRDRRLGCVHRGRRDLLQQSHGPPHRVPVSGGRAGCAGADRTAHRRAAAQGTVVAHLPCHHRRPRGLGPAAHDGRQPGVRVLRAHGTRVRRSRRRS